MSKSLFSWTEIRLALVRSFGLYCSVFGGSVWTMKRRWKTTWSQMTRTFSCNHEHVRPCAHSDNGWAYSAAASLAPSAVFDLSLFRLPLVSLSGLWWIWSASGCTYTRMHSNSFFHPAGKFKRSSLPPPFFHIQKQQKRTNKRAKECSAVWCVAPTFLLLTHKHTGWMAALFYNIEATLPIVFFSPPPNTLAHVHCANTHQDGVRGEFTVFSGYLTARMVFIKIYVGNRNRVPAALIEVMHVIQW